MCCQSLCCHSIVLASSGPRWHTLNVLAVVGAAAVHFNAIAIAAIDTKAAVTAAAIGAIVAVVKHSRLLTAHSNWGGPMRPQQLRAQPTGIYAEVAPARGIAQS